MTTELETYGKKYEGAESDEKENKYHKEGITLQRWWSKGKE